MCDLLTLHNNTTTFRKVPKKYFYIADQKFILFQNAIPLGGTRSLISLQYETVYILQTTTANDINLFTIVWSGPLCGEVGKVVRYLDTVSETDSLHGWTIWSYTMELICNKSSSILYCGLARLHAQKLGHNNHSRFLNDKVSDFTKKIYTHIRSKFDSLYFESW